MTAPITPDERAAVSPVWDEDTVQAEVLGIDARHHFHGTACLCGFDSHGRTRSATEHITSAVLAVVRRHLPVRPDREAVALTLCNEQDSIEHMEQTDDAPCSRCLAWADAVLAEWPGESRAQVEATALREWIAEWPTTPDDGTFLADIARDGLVRANRIEKGDTR